MLPRRQRFRPLIILLVLAACALPFLAIYGLKQAIVDAQTIPGLLTEQEILNKVYDSTVLGAEFLRTSGGGGGGGIAAGDSPTLTGKWTFTPTPTLAAAGTSTIVGSPQVITLSGANPTTYASVDAVNFDSPTLVGTNPNQTVTLGSTMTLKGPVKGANVAATTLAALALPTWACSTATECEAVRITPPTGATYNMGIRAFGVSYFNSILLASSGNNDHLGTDDFRFMSAGNASSFYLGNSVVGMSGNAEFGWNNNANAPWFVALDTKLVRDAANVMAMKNATAAQTIRVYGTTTGNKYLSLTHDGTNPIIGSSSGALKADSTAITPAATGTRYLCITTTGQINSSASACSGT